MTTFIDWIVLSQRHYECDNVRPLAGVRSIAYRSEGDINREGLEVTEEELIGEQFRSAWVQGSHATALQVKSEGGLVTLAGNVGRWSRPDNLFNLDLNGTVEAANRLMQMQRLPIFVAGEPVATSKIGPCMLDGQLVQASGDDMSTVGYSHVLPDGSRRPSARVWSIHVTRNFVCGSEKDALAVLNWLDTQSIARVKKKRFGKSTVVWGNLKYCQVEAYLKADEMLDHCKSANERQLMLLNPAYTWAKENGILRVEVKAAKDYLRDRGLTYLGEWTMENVIQLFDERTEILHRVKCDVEEFDPAMLPSRVATTAAAWLQGCDVTRTMNLRTLQRHAKVLREYGIDISQKRNVSVMPIKIKTIEMQQASIPDWYSMAPTPFIRAA